MQCFFCPNPAAHPATGHQYSDRVIACRECTLRFWKWYETFTNGKGKGKKGGKRKIFVDFYAHVQPFKK